MAIKMERSSGERSGTIETPLREGMKKNSSISKKSGTFDKTVEKVEMEGLLKELDKVASKLSRVPSTVLLGRYRELVSQILKEAMKGLRVKKDLKWRRMERKSFLVVEKTDALFKELEDVLFIESSRTRSLDLMEDIKGCLISLLS